MSIYLSTTGESKGSHIHQCARIAPDDEGNRFRCTTCQATMKRLNGVLIRHAPAMCENTNSWWHSSSVRRGGAWQEQYTCPVCKFSGKFLRNYLGRKQVVCDGTKLIRTEISGE